MGTGNVGQMMGQVYQHKPEFKNGESVDLMCLNGKLYCRSKSEENHPFVVLNTQTLEEQKIEFQLEKEDRNLEWKTDEETGRSLTSTPLLTDGQDIYVIAQYTAAKKKGKILLILILYSHRPRG